MDCIIECNCAIDKYIHWVIRIEVNKFSPLFVQMSVVI